MPIRAFVRARAFTPGLHHLSRCATCIFDIQASLEMPVLRIKKLASIGAKTLPSAPTPISMSRVRGDMEGSAGSGDRVTRRDSGC